jgi:hypothetical protein
MRAGDAYPVTPVVRADVAVITAGSASVSELVNLVRRACGVRTGALLGDVAQSGGRPANQSLVARVVRTKSVRAVADIDGAILAI